MFVVVGKTEDGKIVYSGVFKFYETHGLPLDIILEGLRDKSGIPCWVLFHRESLKAGMKHARILSKLDEAISDVYGSEFRDHVIKTLELLHSKKLL